MSYLRGFNCKYFILNNGKKDLDNFDIKSDEGVFVGYSSSNKAYRVFNKRTQCLEESVYVIIDDSGEVEKLKHQDEAEFEELLQFHKDSVNADQNNESNLE